MLTTTDGPTTWVVVPMTCGTIVRHGRATGWSPPSTPSPSSWPGTRPIWRILRLGAIFFADQGAYGIDEIWLLTLVETVGTILLIVGVFRRLSPLLLNLLALGVGVGVAFAGTFLVFGEIHVAALLFGTSLIGVAVDYGLHYCTTAFGTLATTGRERLFYVLPGITLGLATSLIGYAALAMAPFPGLRQIAVFAIIGLIGAFATVTLWFPLLDRIEAVAPWRRHAARSRSALGVLVGAASAPRPAARC